MLPLTLAAACLVLVPTPGPASATPPTVVAAQVYPVVPGLTAPLGDVAITEAASGQLSPGDVITYRFADSVNGSTLHLASTPQVGGTHGLSATVAIGSSAGTLKDEAVVTIQAASSGSFPGVLTLSGLKASVDGGAAPGNDVVSVSDAATTIASSGSPATTSEANVIGTAPRAVYSAVGKPTLSSTGFVQPAGDLTISEPAKAFFHTGDVITFSIRDTLGSADTVGLAGPPTVSGDGMLVSVSGLSGGPVQPNDTGFKVTIDQQDPSNGSASTLQISNLVYNTGQAPVGPVGISARVTNGASTEYVYPGRVDNASVGGNTTTTSAGRPVLQLGATDQPAANLSITETPGTLKAGTSFSLTVQEPGVTFSSAPIASVTGGDLKMASAVSALDAGHTTATWTVSATSTSTSTVVVGPIKYDVAASGPSAGDPVNLLASGQAGSGFTSQTVSDALIAPAGKTLFTPLSAPATPATAGDLSYQEVVGLQAPTGGSIVLLSPYATQILAYRATFAAVPTATVAPGHGLVLGPASVNTSPLTIVTPDGPIAAPAETVATFPVTTGSTSPASTTFGNISYHLGGLVAPGALVGTAAVDTGANGSGANVAGNDFANALNPAGLGGGGGTALYRPDAQIKKSSAGSFTGNDVYNATGSGQTVSAKVAPGKRTTLVIRVQDDGNSVDGFTLKGPGNQKGFTVKYLQGTSGSTDISAQVEAGAYETLNVAPAGAATIRLVVKARSAVAAGTTKSWTVHATSSNDPSKQDAVKGTVRAT